MRITERRLRSIIRSVLKEEYDATLDFLTGSSKGIEGGQIKSLAGSYMDSPGYDREEGTHDPYFSIRQQINDDLKNNEGRAWQNIVREKLENEYDAGDLDLDSYITSPQKLINSIFRDIMVKLIDSYNEYSGDNPYNSPQQRNTKHATDLRAFVKFMYDPDKKKLGPKMGGGRHAGFDRASIIAAYKKATLQGIKSFKMGKSFDEQEL